MKKLPLFCLLLALVGTGNAQMVQTFPYFQDFESFPTCGTVCGNACSLPLTSFWINVPFGDGLDWTVDENGTPSSNTGPSSDHNPGTSNGNYLYTEASGSCSNDSAFLVTPLLDFSQLQAPTMDFWYHMFGNNMGTLHVDASLDSGTTWIRDITPSWTDNQDLWQQRIVKLNAFAGDTIMIRIRGMTGNGFTSDMAIDDFRFYELPPIELGVVDIPGPVSGCGLGLDSVRITLQNFGGLEYLPGDTVYAGYQIGNNPVANQTFILSDTLAACGGEVNLVFTVPGDFSTVGTYQLSAWSTQPGDADLTNDTLITTIQNFNIHNTFPYFDNLEAGSSEWQTDGFNNSWAYGIPSKSVISGAASGINAWVTGGLSTGDYNNSEASWVENVNCFDFSSQSELWAAAAIWWNSEFSWDGAQLQYSTNAGQTWNVLGAAFEPNNWYTDNTVLGLLNAGFGEDGWSGRQASSNGSGGWVNAKYDLAPLMGLSEVRFRFFFGADGSVTDDGFGFDNFAIAPLPAQPNLGADIDLCDTAVTLNGIVGPGFYTWAHGANGSVISVDTSGTYILTYTDTLGLCSMDTINVILRNTYYPILGADTLLCSGDTAILNAGTDPAITGYVWSTGATTSTLPVNTGGTYWVSVTTNDGCVKSDTVEISAVTLPEIDLGPDTLICGDNYLLDAGTPGAAYVWNTGDTTQTLLVTSSGPYSVALSACSTTVSDTALITLNALPQVNIGPPDTTACGTITLNAGTWSSYLWSPSGGSNATETFTSSGTVSCTMTDTAGCENSDSLLLTVLPLPVPVVTPSDTLFCLGDSVCIQLATPTLGQTYLWSNGDTTTSICATVPGVFWVLCTDTNGCQGSDTSQLSILDPPVLNFTVDTTACPAAFFSVTNSGGPVNAWDWDFGDQSTGTGDTLTHTYMSNDTFIVTLSAGNTCGVDTITREVGIDCLNRRETPENSRQIRLFPNPNQGAFSLEFEGFAPENANIELVNVLGQVQSIKEVQLSPGTSRIDIDLSELVEGTWWVRISVRGEILYRQFLITRK